MSLVLSLRPLGDGAKAEIWVFRLSSPPKTLCCLPNKKLYCMLSPIGIIDWAEDTPGKGEEVTIVPIIIAQLSKCTKNIGLPTKVGEVYGM